MSGNPASGTAMRRVVAATAMGSSHRGSGTPNQDAVRWLPDGAGSRVALCVSDGHGSKACFRSHLGSRFAVEIGCEAGTDFLSRLGNAATSFADFERAAREELGRAVVQRWADVARRHLEEHPLDQDEAQLAVPGDPLLPYGATLLIALVGEDRAALIQLGDGDIVTVSGGGEVRTPLPRDERFVGGETVSLCIPNASELLRVACLDLTEAPVAVFLLATDGYGNSFADSNWQQSAAMDIVGHLQTHGPDWVQQRLETWLAESADVAGDDVTVGMVVTEALEAVPRPAARTRQTGPDPSRPRVARRVAAAAYGDRTLAPSPAPLRPHELRVKWRGQEQVFAPGSPVTLGRDPECDVSVDNRYVSRRHAEIRWEAPEWVVVDMGSRAGTFADGRPVARLPVRDRTTIWLGTDDRGEAVELQTPAGVPLEPAAEPRPPTSHPPTTTVPWSGSGGGSVGGAPASVSDDPRRRQLLVLGGAVAALLLLVLLAAVLSRGGGKPEGVTLTFGHDAQQCGGDAVDTYPADTRQLYPQIKNTGDQQVDVTLSLSGEDAAASAPPKGVILAAGQCQVVAIPVSGEGQYRVVAEWGEKQQEERLVVVEAPPPEPLTTRGKGIFS